MAFRVVLIESEVTVRLNLNNMVITKEGIETWVPLDDVSMIVIDNLTMNITARLLCALSESGIGVIICNTKHLPSGFYSSIGVHSRASKVLKYQIDFMDKADELWAEIIKSKITNQAKTIRKIKPQSEVFDMLLEYANEVSPGDSDNRESFAAKVYFNELMGSSFSRGNEDILMNSGLDYCYAIVRAYIARLCTGYGLNTELGLHHKNEYNSFNLSDDLIEPFRPIVDRYVYSLLAEEEIFTYEHRRRLVNFLNHKIIYHGHKMYICNVLDEYVSQIAGVIMQTRTDIVFPDTDMYIGEEEEGEV